MPYINGFFDVSLQLPEYINRKVSSFYEAEGELKNGVRTVEEFENRKAYVRRYFTEAIGGLDFERTPLCETCCGIVEKNGYVIKKMIFQSLPGIYVTSNLYVPRGVKSDLPAILLACGHSESGKAFPEYQRVCIDLVKNGFAVLVIDPPGQGERMQYYDREAGRTLVGWGTTEHTYGGLQCTLAGSGIARYFIWDHIRALDLLCSMPEIDTGRLGVTGNSGGGMQTAYMMLLDDRIKAAVPCTWLTSREAFHMTGQSQDAEQNIYGAISEGINYDDFMLWFAPKPAMIGAVESDYFPLEGAYRTFERAKKTYALFGCVEKLKLSVTPGEHCYNDLMRQDAVNFFLEHLCGVKGNFITKAGSRAEEAGTLQCTSSGQILEEFGDARTIFDLNLDYMNKHKFKYTLDTESIRNRVKEILNMPVAGGRFNVRMSDETNSGPLSYQDDTIRYRDIVFFPEEQITVDGVYITREGQTSNRCTILLLDRGMISYGREGPLVKKLLQNGDVFIFEPRGTGIIESRAINGAQYDNIFGTTYIMNCDLMMMKTSLAALRVFDTLRACDVVKLLFPGRETALAGKGASAVYALLASVLRDDIREVYLENIIESFEKIVAEKYYKYDLHYDIYGILKYFDIPQLIEAFKENMHIIRFNSPDIGTNIFR